MGYSTGQPPSGISGTGPFSGPPESSTVLSPRGVVGGAGRGLVGRGAAGCVVVASGVVASGVVASGGIDSGVVFSGVVDSGAGHGPVAHRPMPLALASFSAARKRSSY